MPARNLVVVQLAVFASIAISASAIGKTQAFRPNATIDDADDYIFTISADRIPEPVIAGESQEIRRSRSVQKSGRYQRERRQRRQLIASFSPDHGSAWLRSR